MAEAEQLSIDNSSADAFSLTRPFETSTARDARSRDSYTTHRRSTHSSVPQIVTTSLAPPVQEFGPPSAATVRPPSGLLGLHTTNPDPDVEAEYVNIPADISGTVSGYRYAKMDRPPDMQVRKKKGFIGGFVKGLGRIPKAVLRGNGSAPRDPPQNRRAFGGTDTSGTLPRYVSNPTTPAYTLVPPVAVGELSSVAASPPPEANLPPSLVPGGGVQRHRSRRSANPSFQLTSPSTAGTPPFPQPDLSGSVSPERQATRENVETLPATSPHPTRIEVDESQPHISMSPRSRPSAHPVPLQEVSHITGTSLLANPQPTSDYRRMSMTHHTSPASTMSYEPSFSTELNGPQRFFHTLLAMPWISSGRITVDYHPGLSRGGWGWKRIAVGIDKDGTAFIDSGRHEEKRRGKAPGMMYKPVPKPSMPWYSGLHSSAPGGKANITRWVNNVQRDTVDLLSSGGSNSVVRSSMATGTRRSSAAQSPAREKKRRSFSSGQKLYFAPNQFTFLDTSPKMAARAMRKIQRDAAHASAKGKKPSRHSSRTHHRSRRDGSYHGRSPSHPEMMPLYPHGYVPAMPYQPLPPPPPPTTAPFYVLQTQASQQFNPAPNMGNMSDQHLNNSPGGSVGAIPLLSPVFMQVVPTANVPGDTSPPGLAGRGAGGGQAYAYPRYPAPGYSGQLQGSPDNIATPYGDTSNTPGPSHHQER
ncbi:hypothetical protein VKT23_012582 [Stygiomarasmius scandens]|uniref:Uncharacterized protein n=1 Tax=Marasmiellus scandens TaxID=2682957 RepID=A0ABR1J610_9AGAR